jgi:hypothetical protein
MAGICREMVAISPQGATAAKARHSAQVRNHIELQPPDPAFCRRGSRVSQTLPGDCPLVAESPPGPVGELTLPPLGIDIKCSLRPTTRPRVSIYCRSTVRLPSRSFSADELCSDQYGHPSVPRARQRSVLEASSRSNNSAHARFQSCDWAFLRLQCCV